MECSTCGFWLVLCQTEYSCGDVVVNWRPPDGHGKCTGPLKGALTIADFGCNKYKDGGPIHESANKDGAPWHHKKPGPCPDCKTCAYPECGKADCPGPEKCLGTGCGRCVCTGTVLYYDDGFVGENRTKMHPMEAKDGKRHDAPTPSCWNCGKHIDPQWRACPYCGTRLSADRSPTQEGVL
jgi:hypothetical protein